MRKVLVVFAGFAAFVIGWVVGLEVLWPAGGTGGRPSLEHVPALQPISRTSTIIAPAAISMSAIQSAMENAAPRNLNGNRHGATRDLPVNLNIEWVVDRGPLSVAGRQDGLSVTTALNGSLRASGQLLNNDSQLGDTVGSILGQVGGKTGKKIQEIAAKNFDQRQDVRGNVTVSARPAILAPWRIAPNLTAQVAVNDLAIPVGGMRLSVADEIKPLVDKQVNDQIAQLEARVRNDPFLEKTAREQWAKMCQAFPLDIGASGAPRMWLEVKPTRALAAQPRIEANAVKLLIGIEAQTRVVPTQSKPTCPFPAQLELVPQLTPGVVKIGVPIDIPFTNVNKLLDLQLAGKTFPEDDKAPIHITVRRAELAASGDRLLLSLAVKAREHSWFGFGAEALVHVWGKPQLDRDNQTLRLTDIEFDVSSDAAFGLLGAAADVAAPYLRDVLAEKAMVDLKPFAADARTKIEAILADFQKSQAGVRLDAKVNALRLTGIAFDAQTLRVITEAEGSVNVAVTTLAMQ